MSRISASETDLGPLLAGPLRLQPPDHLTGAAREAFIQTVAGAAPDHFEPVDTVLLALYAQAVALERQFTERAAAEDRPLAERASYTEMKRSMAQTVTMYARALAVGPKARRPSRPRAGAAYDLRRRSPWD